MGGVQAKFDACDIVVRIETRSRIPVTAKLKVVLLTHPGEPGHIVQPDCSMTVQDSTLRFSFHISEYFEDQVCSYLVENMPTGSLVLLALRTQITVAASLFSSKISVLCYESYDRKCTKHM
jgi:hypothetical protein